MAGKIKRLMVIGLAVLLVVGTPASGRADVAAGKDSNHGTESFFNPETGRSYTHTFTFNGRDKRVTDNGDGTLTIIFQGSGTDKWHDGDGKLVLRGSGMFRDELRVDHNGTPSDPTDDGEPEFVRNVKPYQHDPFEGRDFCEDFLLFTA